MVISRRGWSRSCWHDVILIGLGIGLGAAGSYIWTAIVLLAAGVLDALARQQPLPGWPAALARDVAGIPVVAYWFAVLSVLRGR